MFRFLERTHMASSEQPIRVSICKIILDQRFIMVVDRARGAALATPTIRASKPGGGGKTTRSKNDKFADGLYFREEDFAVAEHTATVAKERGVTASQIALAWVLNKPYISSPIIGATKMDHLEQAIAALDIKLSEDEVKRLEESYKPHPILGHS